MAERRLQYIPNQQNLDSDSDEADVQHSSSKDSLLNRGFWGTAKFFKLGSKSTPSFPNSEKTSPPETENRIEYSHSPVEGSLKKGRDTKLHNLELFEQFSEIQTVKSLEDQSSESTRKRRNWRDSFFPQRSKSLSSLSFQKSNGGVFENLKTPTSKLFSYFDFQENSVPYGTISDSLTKYLWTTENFQDSPKKQENQKKFQTSVTPLLEKSKGNNCNQNYNYNSFGASVDFNAATNHPLQIDEGQLKGETGYTDISSEIGSDLLWHGSSISNTSSTKDSTSDFTQSYKSETSVTTISNEIHYQNKQNGFKTKIFPRKLKLKIPTSKTESIPLLSGERQNSIEGFEVPTLDSNRKKISSMDRPSCLSPSQSDEVEFEASSTEQNRINANSLESTNFAQENIGGSFIHSTTASFFNNSSYCANTGSMLLHTCVRCVNAALSIPTFGDSLCFPFDVITTNPKVSILSALGSWLVLDLFMLPFWTISTFLVRESLIYITILLGIAFLGRFIIRMIAFPGSSYRVYAEIEKEFTKYSISILDSAASNFCEFAAVILNKSYPNTIERDNVLKNHNLSLPKRNFGKFDVITIYKRSQSFKNRVLSVYLNVFICLFEQNGDGDLPDENSYLDEYGNNKLVGDVGKLTTVSMEARKEGRVLYSLLKEVMDNLEELELDAQNILNATMKTLADQIPTHNATESAKKLLTSASKLKELLSLMKASSEKSSSLTGLDDNKNENNDNEGEDILDSSGSNNEESTFQTIKYCIKSLIPILDPPPHWSIFGLDTLRGCMLSRYIGAKQMWVRRLDGGMIDVVHIPSHKAVEQTSGHIKIKKAVLYCNPNAGLTECATGMSLIGGNVRDDCNPDNCWADFYNDLGYDIFLFNYAGFGRSHGWNEDTRNSYREGILSRLRRMFCRSFIHFKPTPHSLQMDALSTATYIMNEFGVEKFVIHGESIGGLAAASAGRKLTTDIDTTLTAKSNLSLLVCDRTFCNLPAVAQRLVGSWTGFVIPLLTPLWSTDVAGDFMKTRCPKIVAQDAADIIIHDASSLKTGISISHERLLRITKNVGLMENAPLEYRMAEWENVGVTKSSHVNTLKNSIIVAPSWPSDRHISSQQAFHFAACAKRIGKVATAFKKKNQTFQNLKRYSPSFEDEEQGIEISVMNNSREKTLSTNDDCKYTLQNTNEAVQNSADFSKKRELVMNAWKILACCDGMTGMHCGAAVKQGYDCTVSWLYSTVVYGGQVVVSSARKRYALQNHQMNQLNEKLEILRDDFGIFGQNILSRDESQVKPLPIPEVIMHLKKIMEQSISLTEFEIELKYCISMLEYIEKRLMSQQSINNSVQSLNLERVEEDNSVGCFLKLHCGHNNQYKPDERDKFASMLNQISNDS